MAIQTLQGNLIQNQYGGGVVCQGPMLTFSPFVTDSHTYSEPKEYWYQNPVYNDDGTILQSIAMKETFYFIKEHAQDRRIISHLMSVLV